VDLPVELDVILHAFPRGMETNIQGTQWTSKYGYVGFALMSKAEVANNFQDSKKPAGALDFGSYDIVAEGMNERGLSCALQLFGGAKMEQPNTQNPQKNVFSLSFCKWALENFKNVNEVQAALASTRFVISTPVHFVVSDAGPKTVVVEWIDGQKHIHEDMNDGVDTFGILTNQPSFEFHVENTKLFHWKESVARSAIAVPGNWYPDERWLRIHLAKRGIERTKQPTTYQQAIAQTVAVLNTITVPMGDLPGTGGAMEEGDLPSHTLGGLVRDHKNRVYFFRSETNPSFRKIALDDLEFDELDQIISMDVDVDPYFFIDVTGAIEEEGKMGKGKDGKMGKDGKKGMGMGMR